MLILTTLASYLLELMAIKRLHIDFENDAFVLAISCHQKSVKLAWEINKALNCELSAQVSLEENIPFIQGIDGHDYFKWKEPSERYTLHLFSNRGEKSLLVPAQNQIDYFFVVTGLYAELNFEEGTQKIKNIQSVLTAFPITLPAVKK